MPENMPFTKDEFLGSLSCHIRPAQGFDANEYMLSVWLFSEPASIIKKRLLNKNMPWNDKNSRYIYGRFLVHVLKLSDGNYFDDKAKEIKEGMWQVAQEEIEKNPKLKYLLSPSNDEKERGEYADYKQSNRIRPK